MEKAKKEGQDTKRVYDKLYINGSSSDNKVLPGNPIICFKLIYSLGPRRPGKTRSVVIEGGGGGQND